MVTKVKLARASIAFELPYTNKNGQIVAHAKHIVGFLGKVWKDGADDTFHTLPCYCCVCGRIRFAVASQMMGVNFSRFLLLLTSVDRTLLRANNVKKILIHFYN